jgi:hypothetical protein
VDADGVAGRRDDGRFGFTRLLLRLEVETDPAEREQARQLAKQAEATCLVSASLDLPVETEIEVTLRDKLANHVGRAAPDRYDDRDTRPRDVLGAQTSEEIAQLAQQTHAAQGGDQHRLAGAPLENEGLFAVDPVPAPRPISMDESSSTGSGGPVAYPPRKGRVRRRRVRAFRSRSPRRLCPRRRRSRADARESLRPTPPFAFLIVFRSNSGDRCSGHPEGAHPVRGNY